MALVLSSSLVKYRFIFRLRFQFKKILGPKSGIQKFSLNLLAALRELATRQSDIVVSYSNFVQFNSSAR